MSRNPPDVRLFRSGSAYPLRYGSVGRSQTHRGRENGHLREGVVNDGEKES